ncbi:MAG TPA: hypothetical protein VHD32_12635 [Candidatus Didemnitutus sp.]|nr:hypothetical protein [Candidatus Didemnitutus sp.]
MRNLLLVAVVLFVVAPGRSDREITDPNKLVNPFKIVAEKVDLTVGKDLTLVSDRCTLKYVESEDPGHMGMVWIRYPIYADSDFADSDEAARAEDLKLQIGPNTYPPASGGHVEYAVLSDFPIVEGARVFFVTFAIPRDAARLRFDAVITHLQPNFHYRGATVALYTPWLPRQESRGITFGAAEPPFTVTLHAGSGLGLKLLSSAEKALVNTTSAVSVVAEHRQTVAVEVAPTAPAQTGAR